jgi:cation transport protein ChaC
VFLSDRRHPQWVGVLSEDVQAERIAGAEGLSGRNLDYLVDLLDHLRAAGAEDAALERILIKVRRLEAQDAGVEAGVAPLPDAEDSAAS